MLLFLNSFILCFQTNHVPLLCLSSGESGSEAEVRHRALQEQAEAESQEERILRLPVSRGQNQLQGFETRKRKSRTHPGYPTPQQNARVRRRPELHVRQISQEVSVRTRHHSVVYFRMECYWDCPSMLSYWCVYIYIYVYNSILTAA